MKKPQIYYSHPIAGKNPPGNYAEENINCTTAIENVKWLREEFPDVKWYCPGEVELPIQTARKLKLLTVDQILDIDLCIIQHTCSGGLIHLWEPSCGVVKEQKKLIDLKYLHELISESRNIWECDIKTIRKLVTEVLKFNKGNEHVTKN